jgi:hypothetical protein
VANFTRDRAIFAPDPRLCTKMAESHGGTSGRVARRGRDCRAGFARRSFDASVKIPPQSDRQAYDCSASFRENQDLMRHAKARICRQAIHLWKPQWCPHKPLEHLRFLPRQADIRRVTGASSVNLRSPAGERGRAFGDEPGEGDGVMLAIFFEPHGLPISELQPVANDYSYSELATS